MYMCLLTRVKRSWCNKHRESREKSGQYFLQLLATYENIWKTRGGIVVGVEGIFSVLDCDPVPSHTYKPTCAEVRINACAPIHTHTHTHTHTHAYTHTYIHTYIHTYNTHTYNTHTCKHGQMQTHPLINRKHTHLYKTMTRLFTFMQFALSRFRLGPAVCLGRTREVLFVLSLPRWGYN